MTRIVFRFSSMGLTTNQYATPSTPIPRTKRTARIPNTSGSFDLFFGGAAAGAGAAAGPVGSWPVNSRGGGGGGAIEAIVSCPTSGDESCNGCDGCAIGPELWSNDPDAGGSGADTGGGGADTGGGGADAGGGGADAGGGGADACGGGVDAGGGGIEAGIKSPVVTERSSEVFFVFGGLATTVL